MHAHINLSLSGKKKYISACLRRPPDMYVIWMYVKIIQKRGGKGGDIL